MTHSLYALEQLVLRDFKIRYRNMSLGIFWSLLNPLVMVAVYDFVFSQIFPNPDIQHFPLFLLCGIICFNFFSAAWISSTSSITSNSQLVNRVKLPREVLPISSVLANCIHFLIQISLVVVFTLVAGLPIGGSWLWLPPVILMLVAAAAGASLLTSALEVYIRDVRYVVESCLLVLFWLTPVFYSEQRVPAQYKTMYLLNPVAGAAIAMRQIILEQRHPDSLPIYYAAITTGALLMAGISVFELTKKRFADHL